MNGFYKGFTHRHLEDAFGVRFGDEEVTVPYFDEGGQLLREKVFSAEGEPRRWDGEVAEDWQQPPYGLETLALKGPIAFLTEGESCAWAIRAAFPTCPVLGLPGASSWKPAWAELLRDHELIYLSFDADAAGDGRKLPGKKAPTHAPLLETVWPFIPWARRVKLPDGLDTRDVLQLHGGIDEYEALLRDADFITAALRFILNGREPVDLKPLPAIA